MKTLSVLNLQSVVISHLFVLRMKKIVTGVLLLLGAGLKEEDEEERRRGDQC